MSECQTQYKQDAKLDWGIKGVLKEQASGWHGVMKSEKCGKCE